MKKLFAAAAAALALAAPAVAAPFEDRAGKVYFDIDSKSHPEVINMLWDKAQFVEEPYCLDDTNCLQTVYALVDGHVYMLMADVVNGVREDVDLIRNGPLNKEIYYEGYFAHGTYNIDSECKMNIVVENAFTKVYETREVTPLGEGYTCPVR